MRQQIHIINYWFHSHTRLADLKIVSVLKIEAESSSEAPVQFHHFECCYRQGAIVNIDHPESPMSQVIGTRTEHLINSRVVCNYLHEYLSMSSPSYCFSCVNGFIVMFCNRPIHHKRTLNRWLLFSL
jgi:hypothetical protein